MYKIERITDKQGNDKKYDSSAMKRIGRLIDENASDIMVGFPGILVCEDLCKSILTTRIERLWRSMNMIKFETRNSIYYLGKIKVVNDG